MRENTKLALQTALALFITETLCYLFKVEKGYWATLTAMGLTSLTWGESIKRSIERISMTILGGVTATLLYFVLPPMPVYYFICLISFLYFSLLFTISSQLLSLFSMTAFVVFLFGLLSGWTSELLEERIADTILGATVALVIGYFFFSRKPDTNQLLINYFEKLRSYMQAFLETPHLMPSLMTQIMMELDLLLNQSIHISYSLILHHKRNKQFKHLIELLRISSHQLLALINIYSFRNNEFSEHQKTDFMLKIKQTEVNINRLIEQLSTTEKSTLPFLEDIRITHIRENSSAQLFIAHANYVLVQINQSLKSFNEYLNSISSR
ncbi:FUSC family protein [Legionella waltersii]|uniref:Fusaric acid resistance protein family protein n=1 Tax=Legionella waltersii TaxID=66969 RepID=A0A0W1AAR4_9GAMM|nr:FUSC family protein [Legionella waltersii]KTD78395.1 Fusaric acid resistance protein family protein [Legionella waltersii]SNV06270.1 Predicted membrane protein [Legionella waltersii]